MCESRCALARSPTPILALKACPVKTSAQRLSSFANGLDQAFLNLKASHAFASASLVDDRDPVASRLLQPSNQAAYERIVIDRSVELENGQQRDIHLQRRNFF